MEPLKVDWTPMIILYSLICLVCAGIIIWQKSKVGKRWMKGE